MPTALCAIGPWSTTISEAAGMFRHAAYSNIAPALQFCSPLGFMTDQYGTRAASPGHCSFRTQASLLSQ
jgi:hypothetical protein